MSVKKCQKQRGKNFTRSEELTLLKLMKAHKHVLNNNNSDAETWKCKQRAWSTVEQQFAIQTGVHRSYVALRDKYRNLKAKLKSGNTMTKCSIITSEWADSTEQSSSSEYNATDSLQFPIKSEVFDIIELEEPCIQNSPIAHNENSVMPEAATRRPQELLLQQQQQQQQQVLASKRKCALEEETIALIKLQQQFYQDEKMRATEMGHIKRELLELKKELLEVENKLRADAQQSCVKLEKDIL